MHERARLPGDQEHGRGFALTSRTPQAPYDGMDGAVSVLLDQVFHRNKNDPL